MAFIRALVYSVIAGIITVVTFFGGVIISVVMVAVSILTLLAGLFTVIYYMIWESAQDKRKRKENDKGKH